MKCHYCHDEMLKFQVAKWKKLRATDELADEPIHAGCLKLYAKSLSRLADAVYGSSD